MTTIQELYDLDKTIAAELFDGKTYPWEVLDEIKPFILKLGETLSPDEYDHPSEGVWIAKDAKVFQSAYIGAPCIIDHEAEVRHCAFIRGSYVNRITFTSLKLYCPCPYICCAAVSHRARRRWDIYWTRGR